MRMQPDRRGGRDVLAALVAIAALTIGMRAQVIDRILAIVDQQLITLSDVRAVVRLRLLDIAGAADPTGAALDRMIDRRLMLVEVDRYLPPEPTAAAIDARLAKVQEPFGDDAAFQKVLTPLGMSRDDVRRFVRDDLRIEAYLQQRFSGAVQAADRERLIRDWLEGLRRRGNVKRLYRPERAGG
jgi:hypothetical protein